MTKFPFQLLTKHSFVKKQKAGRYIAVLDKGFCQGTGTVEQVGSIEKMDSLMDGGRILKDGDASYVSRVMWDGRDVVVKRYNHKGFIHSLRHTIKKSRARRGWLNGHRLGMINIATPRPLGFIEERKGPLVWKSYLVTEYVRGQNLHSFLCNDSVAEQQRSEEIKQALELIDRMGEYHITHGDLKHTNILVTENGPVLTDLDALQIHRVNWFYKFRRVKDIARFLRKTDVSPAVHDYCRALILEKLKPVRKLADDFDKVRRHNWKIYIRNGFPKDEIINLISAKDSSAKGRSQFTKVPSSDYTRVFKCSISVDGIVHTLYLKQYLSRSVLDFVKHLFRSSRAKRAFIASLMLQKNGLDAPVVIGLFERRLGLFCTDNILLTEEVEDTRPMPELFADICQNHGRNALVRKRGLIKSFAESIGRMHAKGIFHGDLRLFNVLVSEEEEKRRFFFIDNERTRKFYRLPARLRLKNLVQVNMFQSGLSNTDRLRFFKTYLRENLCIQSCYNKWARKIIAKTNLRLRKKDWFESSR